MPPPSKTSSKISSAAPRIAALLGLIVVLAGLVVFIAGLARLQSTTNDLGPASDIPGTDYTAVFTSALVTPYPADHGFQFAFIWFIISFNLFNLVLVAAIVAVPRRTYLGRSAALTLTSIATTLTINVTNSLQSLRSNQGALTIYSKVDLNVAFAGSLVVLLGNFLVILSLGIWQPGSTSTKDLDWNAYSQPRGAITATP